MKGKLFPFLLLPLLIAGCGARENIFREGDEPGRRAEELVYEAKSLQEAGDLKGALAKALQAMQDPQAPKGAVKEASRVAGEVLLDLSGLDVPKVVADVKKALEGEAGKVDEKSLIASVADVGPEGLRWKVSFENIKKGVKHLEAFQGFHEEEQGRPEPNVALSLAVSKGLLAAKRLFNIFDLNRDGNVTPGEVTATFDIDRNGTVSPEEMQAGAGKVAQIIAEGGMTDLLREALDHLEDALQAGEVSPDDPLAELLEQNKGTILDVLGEIEEAGEALDPAFVDRILELIPAQ